MDRLHAERPGLGRHFSAPEAVQGAVAAAILGAGSVHLGPAELGAKMLQGALAPEKRRAARSTRLPTMSSRSSGPPKPRSLVSATEFTTPVIPGPTHCLWWHVRTASTAMPVNCSS